MLFWPRQKKKKDHSSLSVHKQKKNYKAKWFYITQQQYGKLNDSKLSELNEVWGKSATHLEKCYSLLFPFISVAYVWMAQDSLDLDDAIFCYMGTAVSS